MLNNITVATAQVLDLPLVSTSYTHMFSIDFCVQLMSCSHVSLQAIEMTCQHMRIMYTKLVNVTLITNIKFNKSLNVRHKP